MTTNSPVLPTVPSEQDHSHCFIDPSGDALIRRDLHGPDHLEALARQLAKASGTAHAGTRGRHLLRDEVRTGRELKAAHRLIQAAFRRGESNGPESEWLLDNFHIIEDSLREVREDLPRGYYQQLPKLSEGPLAGYPRVFALSLSLIAHTDSGLDEDHIFRFVQAYQSVTPLTTGELWAVPIMLRVGLLENLRRLSRHILQSWHERQRAAQLVQNANRYLEQHNIAHPQSLEEKVWEELCASFQATLHDPFVVHLMELLRDHAVLGKIGLDWLERQLSGQATDADQVFRRESQRLAVNQVCVGNCVTSLRLLSALDWNLFFEKVSPVEKVLRDDPAGVYPRQDFATRDRYRRTIEKLGRGSKVLEQEIAKRSVEMARRAVTPDTPHETGTTGATDTSRSHVGYFLLGKGQAELATAISYRPRLRDRLLDTVLRHPFWFYLGPVSFILLVLLGRPSWRRGPVFSRHSGSDPARVRRAVARQRSGHRSGQLFRDRVATAARATQTGLQKRHPRRLCYLCGHADHVDPC